MAPGPAGPSAPRAARGQLNIIDGLAQLAFVIHGMLERRAGRARSLDDPDPAARRAARPHADHERTGQAARARQVQHHRAGRPGRAPRPGRHASRRAEDRRAVLVGLTDEGRSLVSQAAAGFERGRHSAAGSLARRQTAMHCPRIVSRLLVAHATRHGVDLFAGLDTQVSLSRASSQAPDPHPAADRR